ncbi:LexA family protein [Glaciimonas sp. GNP009]
MSPLDCTQACAPVSLAQYALAAVIAPEACPVPLFLIKIPAGFPSPAADYVEEGLDLNTYLVKHKAASFYFTVEGDSMTGAGILAGDRVLVDRSIEPKHGHIVVAVISNEFTLKRLYRRRGVVELRPENPAYKVIVVSDDDDLQIWGVVAGVVRKFAV